MNNKFHKYCALACVFIGVSAVSARAQNIVLGEPVLLAPAPTQSVGPGIQPVDGGKKSEPSVATVGEINVQRNEPSSPTLVIRRDDRLMPSLRTWLAHQSIELVWMAQGSTAGRIRDVVLEEDFEASSSDIQQTLTELLRPFEFEAELAQNGGSVKRVTVRNARNVL